MTKGVFKMNKKIKIPFFITLVSSFLSLITMFLPYVTANDSYKEILKMSTSDMTNVSLFKYFLTYTSSEYKLLYSGFTILIIAIAVFVFLTILFAILKKPIPTVIFDILSLGVFVRQGMVYKALGVAASYKFSIGYYAFFVTTIITLVSAIWMFISKKQIKKETL